MFLDINNKSCHVPICTEDVVREFSSEIKVKLILIDFTPRMQNCVRYMSSCPNRDGRPSKSYSSWFKAQEPFPSLIPWITSENRLPQLAKKCPLWPQRKGST